MYRSKEEEREYNKYKAAGIGSFVAWLIIFIVLGGMYGWPKYSVYYNEMAGKAEFAKAEQNRKIKIEEAKALHEAADYEAKAEVVRAQGAADAIAVEAGALTTTYIQYLWVRQQTNLNEQTVVYIPTEGNLPLLEAGRANHFKPTPPIETSLSK